MRAFGFLAILLALVIVAIVAKNQLMATRQASPSAASQAASQAGVAAPTVNNAADARRVQDQVKDDVNRMMQDRASQVERGMGEADKP